MQDWLNGVSEDISSLRDTFVNKWNSSQYFRISTIATGSICGYLIGRYTYYKAKQKVYNTPPGPIGPPFIGSVNIFFDRSHLKRLGALYGGMVTIFLGPMNLVIFNDPKLARKYFSNDRANVMAIPESDATFFTTNGKEWAERRRIIFANLMSTMKAAYVEKVTKKFIKTKLFPIFDQHINDNKLIDVKPLFRPIGFNIVLQSCFGKELQSLNDPFWLEWDKRAAEDQSSAEFRLLIWNIFGSSSLTWWLQMKLTGDDFKSNIAINKDIDALEEFAENNKNDISLDDDNDEMKDVKLFNDYVDSYINNKDGVTGKKYSRRNLLGDMVMMLGAATDTTYSALSFSMRLAAKYPKIQQEIYEEIINTFGNNVDNIELRNKGIMKLNKLRAFLHESLRICSPINLSGFRILKEDNVHFGGYYIPKGSLTSINAVGIAYNPKYWIKDYDKNKDKYKNFKMEDIHLDFWLDDEGKFSKKKNAENFFTFHYGKRDCAGQSLAMKEMIIVLAMIFMKYKVESMEGTNNINIKPMFGGVVMEPTVKQIRLIDRN